MRPAALTLGLLAAACTGQGKDGPVEVKFDRDACRACSMIISDRHFVAEVRGGERREVSKFDDIGCALKWLDAQPFAADPSTQVWVAQAGDGAWLDARQARYLSGKTSPMGYGFAAAGGADAGVGFEAMRDQVRAFAQRRH